MDKLVIEEVTTIRRYHEFTCDKCNKFIGKVAEFNDGYYQEMNHYEKNIDLNEINRRYHIDKILCDKCAKELEHKIGDFLVTLGFH